MRYKNLDKVVKVHGWRITGARGINDHGQICGKAQFNGKDTAFLFNLATPTAIADLNVLNASIIEPLGMNTKGYVVGTADVMDQQVKKTLGFFYSPTRDGAPASAVKLQPCKDDGYAYAMSINSQNVIVGHSGKSSSDQGQAAIWTPDAQGKYSMAQSLNDMIDSNSGWKLIVATGINNQGLICGNGLDKSGNKRAFLLTPA